MTCLKFNVLVLPEVFEHIRQTSMKYYNINPTSCMIHPALAWDALLLQTHVELELFRNLDMLNMKENIKRGGLCFV